MQIELLDYTSILIKNSKGKRILMNPLNFIPVKNKYDITPDIITFSNPYTKYSFPEDFYKVKILNSLITYEENNIRITTFPSFCDNCNGLKRGENIIYKIESDNMTICNLGNLGHNISSDLIEMLGSIDLLFLPIGGNFFLTGNLAAKIVKAINPKHVIPTGFSKLSTSTLFSGASYFIRNFNDVLVVHSNKFNTSYPTTISNESLPILLNY